MNEPASFTWRDLHDLFSVVMVVDESMTIVHASDTLGKCMPQTLQRPLLTEVFDSLRPASMDTFSDAITSAGSLCLLRARNGEFAIRGQLIQIDYQGSSALCFCGAPWLFWINANSPETELGLGDFSAQDVQLDQLFFMSTERKMVEDLEKLNRDLKLAKQQLEEAQNAQKQFFAQMSHEIRTPLNGVVSALSLLEQLDQSTEQSRFLRLARSSSENLMQVINYVLDVSKLELSEQSEPEAFSLPDLINNTVDVVKAKAQEKSLPLTLDLSRDLPQICMGSPERFRQTLLNLLINAIKFTSEGEVKLRATTHQRAGDQCTIRLEVTDTGVGIAEDQRDKVFEPFWSSMSDDTAQQERGTGLGLDIVRRNVRSMGGEIHFRSVLAQGTTFTVDLPMALPKEPLELSAPETCDEQTAATLAGRVLLVDDNETNRILGALMLESLGLEVISADCGHAAVTAAHDEAFDLVLMDINMPDIDGFEATRLIRKFILEDQLPIVALTAYVDEGEKAACLKVGMAGYLTKPMVREQLANELAPWLACGDSVTACGSDDAAIHGDSASIEIATGGTSGENLVDPQVLRDLWRQIGQDNFELVVNKVKKESLQRWQELEHAESVADANTVRHHVHSLGSIFRSIGLLSIGDELYEIESCLRAGGTPAPGWLLELEQHCANSLAALDNELLTIAGPAP